MRESTASRASRRGAVARGGGGLEVGFFDEIDVDAELVVLEAGGDVGVGLGVDVGVDAEGNLGLFAEAGGDGID
jgi:hypothetical protein